MMGIAERKIRQKEDVRASILKAAWQLVENEGWQAVSIRKIAEAIEYSVPVIYDHFQNKDAILLEFTKEGFRILTRAAGKSKIAVCRSCTTAGSNSLCLLAFCLRKPGILPVDVRSGYAQLRNGSKNSRIGKLYRDNYVDFERNHSQQQQKGYRSFSEIPHLLVSVAWINFY
jgi:AcrR family transcriptional regulator